MMSGKSCFCVDGQKDRIDKVKNGQSGEWTNIKDIPPSPLPPPSLRLLGAAANVWRLRKCLARGASTAGNLL